MRAILADVAKDYVEMISSPEQVRHVIDRAFRIALAERTVTAVVIPNDLQRLPSTPDVERPPHEHGRQHSTPGFLPPRILPREENLERAADVLNAGRRVTILGGAGARGAAEQVIAAAHALGAGVAKALPGESVLPDDLPFVTGCVGWVGTPASNRMMKECDTRLMVGTSFPYTEFLPQDGQARGLQIDIEPRNLALRYPVEIALAGDSAETLGALLPRLAPRENGEWRSRIEAMVRESLLVAERHAEAPALPINPQFVVRELSRRLPERCIVTGDSARRPSGLHATSRSAETC